MKKYQLSDGRTVLVYEQSFPGMAGEPMTVLKFEDLDGRPVRYKEVIKGVSHKDSHEIREWSDCLADANETAAIAWCI